MADDLTTFYSMLKPKTSDTMSQKVAPETPNLSQNLRDCFERMEKAANPDVILTGVLPQAGNYNIGDRVFLQGTNEGSYILLSKDALWGYIWRPIQKGIAPWVDVPVTAFNGADSVGWTSNVTYPLQYTLDNKGNCYWRGGMTYFSVGLPVAQTKVIFASLPIGLRHHTSGQYMLATDPITPRSTTGIAAFRAARWYIQNDGYNSFRFFGSAESRHVFFDSVEYVCSTEYYYGP